jgi:hypothetical protein
VLEHVSDRRRNPVFRYAGADVRGWGRWLSRVERSSRMPGLGPV